jgi:hypothetical protein
VLLDVGPTTLMNEKHFIRIGGIIVAFPRLRGKARAWALSSDHLSFLVDRIGVPEFSAVPPMLGEHYSQCET